MMSSTATPHHDHQGRIACGRTACYPDPVIQADRIRTGQVRRECSMTELRYRKMHGLGNTYICIDAREAMPSNLPALARRLSDPQQGIGADGLLLMLPPGDPDTAELGMRVFNADGGEAEMCGNGIRCLCRWSIEEGICTGNPIRIESRAGIHSIAWNCGDDGDFSATVDMGIPSFVLGDSLVDPASLYESEDPFVGLLVDGTVYPAILVALGNPHAVIFENPDEPLSLEILGPLVEVHRAFPGGMNLHLVTPIGEGELSMRSWERGSGMTSACGTGASAACAAGCRAGLCGREVLVHLPGGDLEIQWDSVSGRLLMTGPAEGVCCGVVDPC